MITKEKHIYFEKKHGIIIFFTKLGNFLQNRMNEIYQPMDTIHQYLEQFGQYRKATGVI